MLARVFVLVLALSVPAVSLADEAEERQTMSPHPEHPDVMNADTEHGRLLVRIESPIVYLPKGDWYNASNFVLSVAIRTPGGDKYLTSGFIEIDGKPVRVLLAKEDSPIHTKAVRPDLTGLYSFREPGEHAIKIDVGSDRLAIPIKVVELPFPKGIDAGDLVERYGLPSSKSSYGIFWPDTKKIGPIIYSPKAGGPAAVGEQWTFDKLPGAVFSIQQGTLTAVGSLHSAGPAPQSR